MLGDLPPAPRVLDLGCGPGRQTLTLARLTGGRITAVDLMVPFLDALRTRAVEEGLETQIETLQCSMESVRPESGPYDLIWSEGAIYNIGFAAGLAAWRPLLRPGAGLAVSELTWLTDARPERVRTYWSASYPGMRSWPENEARIHETGYQRVGSFELPESDWWDAYYGEIERRIARLRSETSDRAAQDALDAAQEEIDVFRERRGSYGYVFYVMRRPL